MLTAVDFIGLDTFETLPPSPDLAVLSLGDPDTDSPANLSRFPWYSRLEFLDVDPRELEMTNPQVACLPWQMEEIIDFIARIDQDDDEWRLVVHCSFGSSRSAAAALIAHAMTQCRMPRLPEAFGANAWMIALAQSQMGPGLMVPPVPEPDTHVYLPARLQI